MKQYINNWYEIDLSSQQRVNEIQEEINGIEVIDVQLRFEKIKIPSFIAVIVGLFGMVGCYLVGAKTSYWVIFGFAIAFGLAGVIINTTINWNARKVIRDQYEVIRRISNLEDDIKDIQNMASNNKYNLSLEFMDEYMSIVDLGEFTSYYERASVTYGKIKNKQKGKVGAEQLIAIKDVQKIFVKSNEEIVEERIVPVYILNNLASHYRKSTLNTILDFDNNKAVIVATNDKQNISKFKVINPSISNKASYPKKMAQLNGEYYPNVSWESNELDIFRYFTPRKIIFFKEDPNAWMIEHIQNNSLYFQPRDISINWLEIDFSWGVMTPEELIEHVNPFRNDTYPMNINTDQILEDMHKTDTLHR